MYKWELRCFRQRTGGKIGLSGTGSMPRHTMDEFLEKFKDIMEKKGINMFLNKKYVDDTLQIGKNLPQNSIWSREGITREPGDERSDKEA